ncbi:MAG: 2-amino-4-hydroxy-6-hydroxymethyldihydropteridine diphosphokinase [Alphaproteobacteria bacterium]
MVGTAQVLVGFGSNSPGLWGTPAQTIAHAICDLERAGVTVTSVSPFYETAALGRPGQPPYVNAAAAVDTWLPAEALLRVLKSIERRAGRRGGSPWGPRTLDIDILDYKCLVRNWRGKQPRFARAGARPLVLPHPWIEKRPFVLRPLLDVAPSWRHPVTKKRAQEVWQSVARSRKGQVIQAL